jgi:hypothetical protein
MRQPSCSCLWPPGHLEPPKPRPEGESSRFVRSDGHHQRASALEGGSSTSTGDR